jgi:carboxypeptidase Taq
MLARHLPQGARAPEPETLYRAANRVAPGIIRVSADEVSYNLHVILRFELEIALLEGSLEVADVCSAWQERSQEYLGLTPAHDGEGALQDPHWSGGAFGYFPSYTLGNLYAASIYSALRAAVPSLDASVEKGDFTEALAWLRTNVHAHGRLLDAPELIRSAAGQRDHVTDLLEYLRARHGALHGLG